MMRSLSTGLLAGAVLVFYGIPVFAAENCNQFDSVRPQETFKEDPRAIHDCMAEGWDPPVNWRPDKGRGPGIRAGGAGGFSHGTIQAPDMPPWRSQAARQAAASGSSSSGASSSSGGFSFPPWNGWPFSSGGSSGSGSGSSGSGSSGGSCPTSNQDDDATFGAKPALTGSVSLPCGGVAPLTTYQMSISKGADSLFVTEQGYFNYWLYKKVGTSYQLVSQPNAMLPNTLCDGTQLQPPIAQMISFSSASQSIAVRLKPVQVVADPLDPVVPPAEPEKHIVLSLSGGTLSSIGSCIQNANYKHTSAVGDLVLDSLLSGGCEAPPETCTEHGISVTPSALPDCTLTASYPSGANCSTQMQYVLVDRPNLIYPPGSAAVAVPIDGMSSVMAVTVPGNILKTKNGWITRLGDPGAVFVLPQGGTAGLADGNRLRMNGPATISGSGQVTLTHGGALQTKGGSVITEYPDGTVLSPPLIKPVVLTVAQSVELPAGYMVPTSPSANVRLPVETAQ